MTKEIKRTREKELNMRTSGLKACISSWTALLIQIKNNFLSNHSRKRFYRKFSAKFPPGRVRQDMEAYYYLLSFLGNC
jgi:hypothetical protein